MNKNTSDPVSANNVLVASSSASSDVPMSSTGLPIVGMIVAVILIFTGSVMAYRR